MEKYYGKISCSVCKYLEKKEIGFVCSKKVFKYCLAAPSLKERECIIFKFEI